MGRAITHARRLAARPLPILTLFHSTDADSLNQLALPVSLALNQHHISSRLQSIKLSSSGAICGVLAATQVGLNQSLMALRKAPITGLWFADQYADSQGFQGYINPQILSASCPHLVEEQNVSFPFFNAQVRRFQRIRVSYINQTHIPHEEQLQGFKAALFQQGVDSLMGRHILDWRLHLGNIWIQKDVENRLPKTAEVVRQYSQEIKTLLKKFPKLSETPQQLEGQQMQQWMRDRGSSEALSIEDDYMSRIHKHYSRQMTMLMTRLEEGIINVEEQTRTNKIKEQPDAKL